MIRQGMTTIQYFWSKAYIRNDYCVRATALIFDTRTDALVKCQSFETENDSTWGGLDAPSFEFMPNAIAIWTFRARHLLYYVFKYWLWWYTYLRRRVNIWTVKCAREQAFILDTRTGVRVKLSTFLREKMSRSEGDSTPQPSDSCECSNHLRYQGQTFAVPYF